MFGFVENAFNDPFYYFSWVFVVIVSVVMHELAHGWAAIKLGDHTPIDSGHMTGNPLIHMGPISIIVLFLIGIGWGAMPIDPSRIRGKRGEAIVAAAGPAMNLIIAVIALTALGAIYVFGGEAQSQQMDNIHSLLTMFGVLNIALAIFNLAPIPPLDGSAILANYKHGYRRWLMEHHDKHGLMFMGYFIIMSGLISNGTGIWAWGSYFASIYLAVIEAIFLLFTG